METENLSLTCTKEQWILLGFVCLVFSHISQQYVRVNN